MDRRIVRAVGVLLILAAQAHAGVVLTADATGARRDDGSFAVRSATLLTLTATEPADTPDVIYHIALGLYGEDTGKPPLGKTAFRTQSYPNVKKAELTFTLDALPDGTRLRDGIYHVTWRCSVYAGQDGHIETRDGVARLRLSNPVALSPKASRPANLPAGTAWNLVENPGLERADPAQADRPAGFASVTHGHGTPDNVKFSWESPGCTGAKCVAIDALDVYLGYWGATVPVKPRTEYRIAFKYKCRSLAATAPTGSEAAFRTGRPGGPNLELGVVSDAHPAPGALPPWSDTAVPLGPRGGTYAPVATEWASFSQTVATDDDQTRLSLKLRMFCSIQKVWFDDLTVVEVADLPKIVLVAPAARAVVSGRDARLEWQGPDGIYFVEYSPSPLYPSDRTRQVKTTTLSVRIPDALADGRWFWRVGVPEQNGIPVWVAEGEFQAGRPDWASGDTTPPTVALGRPLPNAAAPADAVISAQFADVGDGVDARSARILLDGRDMTAQAAVTERGFSLKPAAPLARGAHAVTASVADKAGNRSNVLSWRFGVGETLRYAMTIEGRRSLLDGAPYFPIGIWNYRCHPGDGRFDEAHLAAAGAAGVDVVLNTLPPGLDLIHKHGMKSLMNLTADLQAIVRGGGPATAEAVLLTPGDPERGQAQFRNHPATLGYWADDPENIENTDAGPIPATTTATIEAVRAVLRQHDPGHPLIFAIANLPRLREAGRLADIILCYRYPVPQYHPQVIDPYTLSYVKSVFPDKPLFFNSQALDLAGSDAQYTDPRGLRPTLAEMRVMAYHALVLGITGYTFYANYLNEQDTPAHWAEVLRIATEFRRLAPALAEGREGRSAALRADSTFGSLYARELTSGGETFLIAVNLSGGRVDGTWDLDAPRRVRALFEDRAAPAPVRAVRDVFDPFAVHVYHWETAP